MSVDTVTLQAGHVESPKEDACEGVLQQLEQQASATDMQITQTAGAAEGAKAKEQGASAEAKNAESASCTPKSGNATGEVATNIIGQVASAMGVGGVVEGATMLSDIRSDKSSNHAAAKMNKLMPGMASNAKSIDDVFKSGKKNKIDSPIKGRGNDEKLGAFFAYGASKSKHIKGAKASEESIGQLNKTCEVARSMAPKMLEVKAQIARVRGIQGPSRGSGAASPSMSKHNGPKGYKAPETKEAADNNIWSETGSA